LTPKALKSLEPEATYQELNERLKYPINPAYFPMNRRKNSE
jgi:hypothetical protein